MTEQPLDYSSSGVSIEAQDAAIEAFRRDVESTHGPEVLAGVGAFGAAIQPNITGMDAPVLVSSTDSLGTKTILHGRFGTWEHAGRDVVGCVMNDVICSGARPLYFLDYIALHKVIPSQIHRIVGKGIAAACKEIDCALIGGEIAEMRDVYQEGDFDLVGFAVGLVDRDRMIDGSQCNKESVLIGLGSNGVHCNGFSLVRAAFKDLTEDEWLANHEDLGGCLAQVLMNPTICYASVVDAMMKHGILQAAAHISGGGLQDNVPRVIPDSLAVRIDRGKIAIPPVFDIIQRHGKISQDEMWHVFNMGIGFVLIVAPENVEQTLEIAREFNPSIIGSLSDRTDGNNLIFID